MFTKEINDLAERKRLIALQADVYRGVIDLDCAALRERVDSARAAVRTGKYWVLAAGGVAGLLATKRGHGLLHWIPRAFAAWRWFRRLQTGKE